MLHPQQRTCQSSELTHVALLVMLPTSGHNQSANAALAVGHAARGTYWTTPSHRARLAEMGPFLVPSPPNHRRNHEGSLLQEPRLSDGRRPWRFTRASVPSFRESYPKCPFDLPVSKHTRTFWQTRRRGKRPSATFSSVRFIFSGNL
jgi:hypothetical protein